MTHRSTALLAAAATVVATTAVGLGATPAFAEDPEVIRRGNCAVAADWKLKVGSEDRNRLEVELEIEDGAPRARWRIAVRVNGVRVVTTARVADAVGDVRLDRVLQGRRGADTVRFRATTAAGEVCRGVATLP